jgi:hypothetical protein
VPPWQLKEREAQELAAAKEARRLAREQKTKEKEARKGAEREKQAQRRARERQKKEEAQALAEREKQRVREEAAQRKRQADEKTVLRLQQRGLPIPAKLQGVADDLEAAVAPQRARQAEEEAALLAGLYGGARTGGLAEVAAAGAAGPGASGGGDGGAFNKPAAGPRDSVARLEPAGSSSSSSSSSGSVSGAVAPTAGAGIGSAQHQLMQPQSPTSSFGGFGHNNSADSPSRAAVDHTEQATVVAAAATAVPAPQTPPAAPSSAADDTNTTAPAATPVEVEKVDASSTGAKLALSEVMPTEDGAQPVASPASTAAAAATTASGDSSQEAAGTDGASLTSRPVQPEASTMLPATAAATATTPSNTPTDPTSSQVPSSVGDATEASTGATFHQQIAAAPSALHTANAAAVPPGAPVPRMPATTETADQHGGAPGAPPMQPQSPHRPPPPIQPSPRGQQHAMGGPSSWRAGRRPPPLSPLRSPGPFVLMHSVSAARANLDCRNHPTQQLVRELRSGHYDNPAPTLLQQMEAAQISPQQAGSALGAVSPRNP